jgi:hypothetical protein
MVNFFSVFYYWRKTRKPDGNFFVASEAWELACMSIIGGDDGVVVDADESITTATAELGFSLKTEIIERGGHGVNFLSRFYTSEVWDGNPNSCCDIKRQIAKFHTTPVLPCTVTPEEKLLEKARSYYYTDANTPILGHLARRVLMVNDMMPEISPHLAMVRWGSDAAVDEQWPNSYHTDFQRLCEQQLPEFDMGIFLGALNKAQCLQDFLRLPLCSPMAHPPPRATAVVGNEVHYIPGSERLTLPKRPTLPNRRGKRGGRGRQTTAGTGESAAVASGH